MGNSCCGWWWKLDVGAIKEDIMKKGIIFIAMMFLMGVCYGEVSFTYEKKDKDVLKIVEVETITRISETNITIKTLRARIESLEGQKTNALEYYNETIAKLNEKITFIKTQIDKAIELGVVEPILEIE